VFSRQPSITAAVVRVAPTGHRPSGVLARLKPHGLHGIITGRCNLVYATRHPRWRHCVAYVQITPFCMNRFRILEHILVPNVTHVSVRSTGHFLWAPYAFETAPPPPTPRWFPVYGLLCDLGRRGVFVPSAYILPTISALTALSLGLGSCCIAIHGRPGTWGESPVVGRKPLLKLRASSCSPRQFLCSPTRSRRSGRVFGHILKEGPSNNDSLPAFLLASLGGMCVFFFF